jgi:predicted lysophospholipase L1 biosynthesis ABC-type transport system permease subunit
MDQLRETTEDISHIRAMMERTSKFLSLSGLAGVSAGITALIGSYAAYVKLSRPAEEGLLDFFIIDAFVVLVISVSLAVFFTVRMAKKKNLPVWSPSTKYLLANLIIPLLAGKAFCLIMFQHGMVIFIPPATLLFYGLALTSASKYTSHEVFFLGLAEIILGLLAFLLLDAWLILWAIGFGALHIAYGILMYMKYKL